MPPFSTSIQEPDRASPCVLDGGASFSHGTAKKVREDEQPKAAGRPLQLLLLILIVMAAVLRIIATRNDLWLDELISLKIAQAVKTPWQIFTAVHSDNNHYVNTIFLYFMKRQADGAADRYLSVLWGIALVPAGYWLLARRSQLEALILSGLLAFSYPLIHFSSEARGYSGAVLGLMLACGTISRWIVARLNSQKVCHSERSEEPAVFLERPWLRGAIYSAGLVLALLSHLTAALVWFALAAGSLIAVVGRAERRKWIGQWAAFNTLPAAVLLALYFFDLRYLSELGGSPMSVMHGLSRLLALGIGWPAKDAISVWILLLPLVGLIVWHLLREKKSGEPLSILLAAIYILPLLCTLAMRPTFFSPRYFLVVLPFFYVSLAMLLGQLARVRGGRFVVVSLLILFFAGQARLYVELLQVGRGQYRSALTYMMAHTTSADVTVASNQDFRSHIELAYYVPRVMGTRQLLYGPAEGSRSFQPEWYILHQEGCEAPGPERWTGPGQTQWHRAAYFGASELSGQAWTIYQRLPPGASPSD